MVSRTSGAPQDVAHYSSPLPPNNPGQNLPPNPNVFNYCSGNAVDMSATCELASLEAINRGRASEGLGPMSLPSNWSALTPAEQLFVATNLERMARGLRPFAGMSSVLDSATMGAANANTDATPPGGFPASYWTSNWAGGVGSPLESIYLWMYDDGPGSPNVDCQGGNTSGCWGHRDDILAPFACSPCVMGSSMAATAYQGEPSWAELMVDTSGRPALAFSWSDLRWSKSPSTVVGMTATAAKGYWLVSANGAVHNFGGAPNYGSAGVPAGQVVVGIAATPDGAGYWLVTSRGNVYQFGDAHYFGSTGNRRLARPIVGMTSTPDGDGYWLVASDGGVFCFGDAAYHGSTGNRRLFRPVVGISATPDGAGYWLVASDGGIFSFGNAGFHGSTGAMRLNRPVVGMTPSFDGHGYWLVASDGGIFSFGDAHFHGSTGNLRLAAPMVGMASPASSGYWLVAS
ncbi:MAG TPA: hypothetical protein VGP46_05860, partial [Acidimicrobiales bacterium]|nr:hypothetical protein [Acidimicrobiales bacterium]